MIGYFDFLLTFTDKIPALTSALMDFGGNASTSRYPARHTNIGIVFQDFPYMHFHWMAISSRINFIFVVSECSLTIENLILKKKLM